MGDNGKGLAREQGMDSVAGRMVAKMRLDFDEAVLKDVIKAGQLREFAGMAAQLAAAHVSAQIVDKVADMAVGGSGRGVGAGFIFEGGDFGTVPPFPKWGVGPIGDILQRFDPGKQLGPQLQR
jgi:hypothetical protein